jgi:hypothetical protein
MIMKPIILTLLLTASCGPSFADGMLPDDVEKFLWKREGCDHFRGELPEPGQKARMREIQREIRRLCTGTDRELAKLKAKYAVEPKVMARLNEFDPVIEAPRQSPSTDRSGRSVPSAGK